MKIWFPGLYTEAHRTPDRQHDLEVALNSVGIECVLDQKRQGCDLVFCGSIYRAEHVRRVKPIGVPIVHYNWDLYKWMIEHDNSMDWKAYLEDLKTCAEVIVPSRCTETRTIEYAGRGAKVVLAPVKIWDVPTNDEIVRTPRTYALDVMRDYKWDPGHNWTERACRTLGIPLIRTKTTANWDEFRWYVANAKLLLSCYNEASTGGLTLLEGYAHGVPCLLSNSPWMGASDYFGDRAAYFSGANFVDLIATLKREWDKPYEDRTAERRAWIEQNFSDLRFATDLKGVFESCLNRK